MRLLQVPCLCMIAPQGSRIANISYILRFHISSKVIASQGSVECRLALNEHDSFTSKASNWDPGAAGSCGPRQCAPISPHPTFSEVGEG
jgi:hypothetical protein